MVHVHSFCLSMWELNDKQWHIYSVLGHLKVAATSFKNMRFRGSLSEMFRLFLTKSDDQRLHKHSKNLGRFSQNRLCYSPFNPTTWMDEFIKAGNTWVSRSTELKLHKNWLSTVQSFVTLQVHFCGHVWQRQQQMWSKICITLHNNE